MTTSSLQYSILATLRPLMDSLREIARKFTEWVRKTFTFKRTKQNEIIIRVRKDGSRCMVYNDSFPVSALGAPQVSRASNVEFNAGTGEWEVVMVGETEPRFSDASRAKCITWEVNYIHENFGKVLEHHFPQNHEGENL